MTSTGPQGRYQLGEVLGRGGMGVVYRAQDTQMKREVALKTLLDVDSTAALELFSKEWGLLATVVHPNIVGIYDVGEFELEGVKRPFFVMPLLVGHTLEELIRQKSPRLTVESTIGVLVQACRGLQAAHELGLIHRDIKPSNLFVLDDDSVKLIDFGIARLARTASGTVLKGTICYMAPELFQKKAPSALSDLFSLAVVAYETLGGLRPFEGESTREMIAAVMRRNPPPLSELNPAVNYAISQVVHKGMAKQPWHRFHSAREFGEALQRAARNEPLELAPPGAIAARIERAARTLERGDFEFASELLAELESEGHLDPKISLLRRQVEQVLSQAEISKLLESARKFYSAHEYTLALRKTLEALDLDAGNAAAAELKAEIERARSAERIDEWRQAARQSLENFDFRQAREAVAKVAKLRPDDPEIPALRAEIDRREQELARSREQKARLYKQAMEGWEQGDISAAFGRLEALMALQRDQPDTGGQNDMYMKFYEQVRAEREAVSRAYEEAQRLLEAGDQEAALGLCRQYLKRFPAHARFQALKCKAEGKQQQRQTSAAAAEMIREAEQEPSLERRVSKLEAALEGRPGDAGLRRALELTREKRDLVNSIAARARRLEEQGRYGEALEQWELLRATHPEHPGLDAQLDRVARALEQHRGRERRSRWLEEIERRRRSGERDEALRTVERAMAEFPDDPDLRRIEQSIRGGGPEAPEAPAVTPADDGIVTSVLVGALLDQAEKMIDNDPDAAEAMVERVQALDPAHPGAKKLRESLSERRREEYLEWCLAQVRGLMDRGETEEARAVLKQGLLTYPEEPLLEALRADLGEDEPVSAEPTVVEPPPEADPTVIRPVKRTPKPAARRPAVQGLRWRMILPIAALAAIFLVSVLVVSVVSRRGQPKPTPVSKEAVVVSVSALPDGAALAVDGQPCGISQCEPRLTPGTHRVEASLAGYQPAVLEFTVDPMRRQPVHLTLTRAGTVVRVYSDLDNATVLLNDAPAGQIQNGEFELPSVPPGSHTLGLAGPRGRATVAFEAAPGSAPRLRQPPAAGGLRTVVVASLGSAARVWSNAAGAEAVVDGQPRGPLGPEGAALEGLGEGPHELALRAGVREQRLVFAVEAGPVLTAYLGSDTSQGSLRIATNEDGVAVFVNGRRQRQTTRRGRLLLMLAPGRYSVRVEKAGFEALPERPVDLRAGEESRLEFRLNPTPRYAAFQIRNGAPGAEVLVDGKLVGVIGPDGSFLHSKLDPPGRHTVTVRKELHRPRQFDQEFPPGAVVDVEGNLEALVGTLRIEATPGPPEVRLALRREGETADRPITETTLQLPEGTYRITGTADGYQSASASVRVTAGRTSNAALALRRIEPPKPVVRQPLATLADWEKAGGWTREGSMLVRRGGNVVVAPLAPMAGSYTFTVELQRGSRLEWLVNYRDDRNYVHYQLDRNNFVRQEVVNGRRSDAVRTPHGLERGLPVSIQIDVSNEAIVHRVRRGDRWQFLEEFRKPAGNMLGGPFAFRIGGRDQIGLSEFRFVPR